MYRLSNYIITEKNEESLKIISLKNGTEIILTETSYQNEFKKIMKFKLIETLETELEKALYTYGFIVKNDTDEVKIVIDESKKKLTDTLKITILPTEKCNFRCSYCYQEFKNDSLTKDDINAIKKFITKEIGDNMYKSLHLNWFGGEPLLEIDTIIEMNTFAQKLKVENEMNFASNITTNGYLLNVNLLENLISVGVNVFQITLDGIKHDEQRKHKNGRRTYEKILQNIISAKKTNLKFHIIIRQNIVLDSFSQTYYDELAMHLKGDERFSFLLREVGKWGGKNDGNLTVLETHKQIKEAVLLHQFYIKKVGLFLNELEYKPMGSVCYAAYPNSYVFRANRKIVKCTLGLDEKHNIIGKIQDGNVLIYDQNQKRWSEHQLTDNCKKCEYLPICLNRSCPNLKITRKLVNRCPRGKWMNEGENRWK